jgi:hypothetical protein
MDNITKGATYLRHYGNFDTNIETNMDYVVDDF